jgi:hypothetical protein
MSSLFPAAKILLLAVANGVYVVAVQFLFTVRSLSVRSFISYHEGDASPFEIEYNR